MRRVLGVSLCLALITMTALAAEPFKPTGKTYYTRVNIWYEDAQEILTTNYHKGMIIPAGTEVEITRYGKGSFSFREKGRSAEYTILHAAKHSRLTLEQEFKRLLDVKKYTRKDWDGNTFTPLELENIKNGTYAIGMSKNAVLVAYGYPPSHVTASTDQDMWTYWRHRAARSLLGFRDGVLTQIEE